MSWFGDPFGARGLPSSVTVAEDTCPDLAVAEGVTLERRRVLQVSVAAAAAFLASVRPGRAQDEPVVPDDDAEDGPLTLRQFLDLVLPMAQRQVKTGGKAEHAYLFRVASLLSRLSDPEADTRQAMRALQEQHGRDRASVPLAAVQLRLKPGGGFSHHDHRDYNGVILGLEGEVRIKNYDILGDEIVPPKDTTFQIRETRDDLITAGGFSYLARRRDNVHELVAGEEGARVLDVFTFFERGSRSYFMEVDGKPRDEQRRVFDAAWK